MSRSERPTPPRVSSTRSCSGRTSTPRSAVRFANHRPSRSRSKSPDGARGRGVIAGARVIRTVVFDMDEVAAGEMLYLDDDSAHVAGAREAGLLAERVGGAGDVRPSLAAHRLAHA